MAANVEAKIDGNNQELANNRKSQCRLATRVVTRSKAQPQIVAGRGRARLQLGPSCDGVRWSGAGGMRVPMVHGAVIALLSVAEKHTRRDSRQRNRFAASAKLLATNFNAGSGGSGFAPSHP